MSNTNIKTAKLTVDGGFLVNEGEASEQIVYLNPENKSDLAIALFTFLKENKGAAQNAETTEEKATKKARSTYNSKLKVESGASGLRSAALSLLAQKAESEDESLYTALMTDAELSQIFEKWERVGNTETSIKNINALTGDIAKVLSQKVGDKGRTIKDYVIYTMAEATNQLQQFELLEETEA